MNRSTETCDECGSTYFTGTTEMNSMCPECSHVIYGYKSCSHEFDNNRCKKCNWDGSISEYVKELKDMANTSSNEL